MKKLKKAKTIIPEDVQYRTKLKRAQKLEMNAININGKKELNIKRQPYLAACKDIQKNQKEIDILKELSKKGISELKKRDKENETAQKIKDIVETAIKKMATMEQENKRLKETKINYATQIGHIKKETSIKIAEISNKYKKKLITFNRLNSAAHRRSIVIKDIENGEQLDELLNELPLEGELKKEDGNIYLKLPTRDQAVEWIEKLNHFDEDKKLNVQWDTRILYPTEEAEVQEESENPYATTSHVKEEENERDVNNVMEDDEDDKNDNVMKEDDDDIPEISDISDDDIQDIPDISDISDGDIPDISDISDNDNDDDLNLNSDFSEDDE
eukprot:CAMPEP_0117419954 /NCGR_PEP_ID=MMETSP0758-20121206/1411_1 /TAXON_ID=63605 /ORGANISM="Percolomonas cosmopolitus, Strain AE-1 (ATCC 50343)" /LENGTH=328 /DNA_ID=CAMNT_0005201325 /DNA_START=610 /DNA_END=1596 /DNA_ORIENTATION=-